MNPNRKMKKRITIILSGENKSTTQRRKRSHNTKMTWKIWILKRVKSKIWKYLKVILKISVESKK